MPVSLSLATWCGEVAEITDTSFLSYIKAVSKLEEESVDICPTITTGTEENFAPGRI